LLERAWFEPSVHVVGSRDIGLYFAFGKPLR
jgi:hypothetical protein